MSRSSQSDSRAPRRQFLGELAVGAAAIAAAACTPAAQTTAASQAPAPATPPPQSEGQQQSMSMPTPPSTWDSSWMSRITALWHAMSYLGSVKDVFGTGDSDASVVVVLRHRAVPLLFNDAMWAKYDIGAATKTMDKAGKPATRNTYYQNVDAQGNPKDDSRPTPLIKALSARGVIFVGCDMATRGFSSRAAAAKKLPVQQVYDEIRANLVPGATLMPTGVFAMLLAQEAGCSLMKST